MIGFENQNNQASLNLTDSMENLVLDDDNDGSSFVLFKRAMESSVSVSGSHHHPLSSSPPSSKTNNGNFYPDFISHPLKQVVEEEENDVKNSKNPNMFDNLEPPSYVDVVFSPFTNNGGSNRGGDDSNDGGIMVESSRTQDSPGSFRNLSRTETGTALLNTNYLKISVSNPQKETETTNSLVPSGGTYATYQINMMTNWLSIEDRSLV